MKVRVKKDMTGYYGHKRRRNGEVFDIVGSHTVKRKDKYGKVTEVKVDDFSSKWMEKVKVNQPVAEVTVEEETTPEVIEKVVEKTSEPKKSFTGAGKKGK